MSARHRLASALHRAIVGAMWLRRWPGGGRVWNRLWSVEWERPLPEITTVVHGRPIVLPFRHSYPVNHRMYPLLNAPLAQLVLAAAGAAGRPVQVVDVGANVGDTALLLRAECGDRLGHITCIEGDRYFFALLKENLAGLPNARLIFALLSDAPSRARGLVRTASGTARAAAERMVPTVTLDELFPTGHLASTDVLKIDVDGFDGRVLAGARRLLSEDHPLTIFEWHPHLCQTAGNDVSEHFRVLAESGYQRFVWFRKDGVFSHVSGRPSLADLSICAEICWREIVERDRHFDVIALHESSTVDPVALAEMTAVRQVRAVRPA